MNDPNPKTTVAQFFQLHLKRNIAKGEIVYESWPTAAGIQAMLTLKCMDDQQFTGEPCLDQKKAEQSAAQQFIEKNKDMLEAAFSQTKKQKGDKGAKERPAKKQKVVEPPQDWLSNPGEGKSNQRPPAKRKTVTNGDAFAEWTDVGVAPKAALNELCMKHAGDPKIWPRGAIQYKTQKMGQDMFQSTCSIPRLGGDYGMGFQGEVSPDRKVAEHTAAGVCYEYMQTDANIEEVFALFKSQPQEEEPSYPKNVNPAYKDWMKSGSEPPANIGPFKTSGESYKSTLNGFCMKLFRTHEYFKGSINYDTQKVDGGYQSTCTIGIMEGEYATGFPGEICKSFKAAEQSAAAACIAYMQNDPNISQNLVASSRRPHKNQAHAESLVGETVGLGIVPPPPPVEGPIPVGVTVPPQAELANHQASSQKRANKKAKAKPKKSAPVVVPPPGAVQPGTYYADPTGDDGSHGQEEQVAGDAMAIEDAGDDGSQGQWWPEQWQEEQTQEEQPQEQSQEPLSEASGGLVEGLPGAPPPMTLLDAPVSDAHSVSSGVLPPSAAPAAPSTVQDVRQLLALGEKLSKELGIPLADVPKETLYAEIRKVQGGGDSETSAPKVVPPPPPIAAPALADAPDPTPPPPPPVFEQKADDAPLWVPRGVGRGEVGAPQDPAAGASNGIGRGVGRGAGRGDAEPLWVPRGVGRGASLADIGLPSAPSGVGRGAGRGDIGMPPGLQLL